MTTVTVYDIFERLVARWQIILFSTLVWFAVEHGSRLLIRLISNRRYRALTTLQRQEVGVRFAAIINSIVCYRTAYWCARTYFVDNNFSWSPTFADDATMEFNRFAIVGYFTWDVIITVQYREGWAFFIHGVMAWVGTVVLSYPLEEHLGSYYTGVFETSSALYHTRALLEMFDLAPLMQTVLAGIFVLLFGLIRVIGGTAVLWSSIDTLMQSRVHQILLGVSVVVVGLQYVWFIGILKMIRESMGQQKSKKTNQKRK